MTVASSATLARGIAAGRHRTDIACFHSRPSAPRRMGSSTNRHDSAAKMIVSATCSTERSASGAGNAVEGLVSTMIGACHR